MKKGRISEWLWLIIPAVVLLCGGIYFFSEMHHETEENLLPGKKPTPEKNIATEIKPESGPEGSKIEKQALGVEQEISLSNQVKTETVETPSSAHPEIGSAGQLEKDISEFFIFLDQQDDIRKLDSKIDTCDRFQKILIRLSQNPPVPAGEANSPKTLIKNMCYFYRTLHPKDIPLIKAVIANTQDTLELDSKMFYQWLTLGSGPPSLELLRPNKNVQYQFAGFFLNTMGGRGYLFRRAPKLRILVTYYSILTLFEIDKLGQNSFGLDTSLFAAQLKEELVNYTNFQYVKEYNERLGLIQEYYAQKK